MAHDVARTRTTYQKTAPVQAASKQEPVNPSDQIFAGRPIPFKDSVELTGRRPFSIPITPPLYFKDGVSGASEVVTSRYAKGQQFGADAGQDKVPYTSDAGKEVYTMNGALIYGT